MSTGGAGNVVEMSRYRATESVEAREPATLVLSIYQREADIPMYRIVGVNDALPMNKLFRVVELCFSFPEEGRFSVVGCSHEGSVCVECARARENGGGVPAGGGGAGVESTASGTDPAPSSASADGAGTANNQGSGAGSRATSDAPGCTVNNPGGAADFRVGGPRCPGIDSVLDASPTYDQPIFQWLSGVGESVDLARREGTEVYPFHVEVVECYLRDNGTPDALCVGGDEFTDLDSINAALTGAATTAHILALTRDDVRDVIERSGIFDFVPLLQALDLERELNLDARTVELCRSVPVETDPPGRDAALIQILCQSALGEAELREEILETTMAAIGWVADDGTPLALAEIDQLSAQTLDVFRELGLMGDNRRSPVERLELCRAIVRATIDSPETGKLHEREGTEQP